MHTKRSKTRRQRYSEKLKEAVFLPLELCTVNFQSDQNLGYLIRAAACFGVKKINVIGSIPPRKELNIFSGTLYDYVKIEGFRNPSKYLSYTENKGGQIISAEISNSSKPITSFDFSSYSNIHLVVGNESYGVPEEILRRSRQVHIPMPGVGFCLNTAQAANVFLYEISRQVNQA